MLPFNSIPKLEAFASGQSLAKTKRSTRSRLYTLVGTPRMRVLSPQLFDVQETISQGESTRDASPVHQACTISVPQVQLVQITLYATQFHPRCDSLCNL